MREDIISVPYTQLTKEEKKTFRKRVLKETLKTSAVPVGLALVGGTVIGVVSIILDKDRTKEEK